MKYQVSNVVNKTSASGTNYIQVSLTDTEGVIYDRINLFKGEGVGKTEVEGNLVKKGEFLNFEAIVVHTNNFPSKSSGIAQAQVRKQEGIEHSQDRKEQGIAHSGSISNATNLVVAMINAGIIPNVSSENEIQEYIVRYGKWYKTMYNNPSSFEQPPF